ncbi:MAG: signal peptidase II [Candidatus Omnitrophica bacterium]|nr:signal peptidase II [Candidatus Omnitrophota bacterium]
MSEGAGKSGRKAAIEALTFFYSGFLTAFVLDRVTKIIILLMIPENSSLQVFRFLYITNIKNPGICFGFLDNPVYLPVLIFASVIALGFIIVYIHKKKKALPVFPGFCFGLISGGILGNLVDRVVHRGVIDFIDFRVWPVFNLADTFIVCGIAFLVFFYSRRNDASCMF